ncbi:MAG: hypothetical protein NTZ59_11495 [Bacteroidetes bacterium]|nr:hypothetical protein [Bacteroidota bacterium]
MHTPTLTIVEKNRIKASTLEQRVCEILQWTDEQYAEFMFINGLKYLKRYFQNNTELIDEFKLNKLFWSWWKNSWAIRNEVFVSDVERMNIVNGFETARRVNEAIYLGLNCPKELSKELKPDVVLYNSIKESKQL